MPWQPPDLWTFHKGAWRSVGIGQDSSGCATRLITIRHLLTVHTSFHNQVLSRSEVPELLLLAGVLAPAFAYLDVPLWNALLFSLAVISQAAFGTVILTRIFKGVPASLLLLLGPGLILGGALSFALFQIVARGVLGLVVVVMVGFASVVYLLRTPNWQPLGSERLWILGQVVGLAALALTWEFPELLPVAIAFFVLGFVTGDMFTTPRWVKQVAAAVAAVAIITPLFFRQEYWWMVTDDYQFFEVLSQHLTHSGPFADWGVTNFSRYHWLSYGWAGLLNEFGGRPETFTTLTRVMPLVYSVTLTGSLVHMAGYLNRTSNWNLSLVPVWTILAINRLDWSGTSTAGVFAVVAATAAVILLALGTTQSFGRRVLLYMLFGIGTVFTKLPSLFTVVIIILCAETFVLTRQFATRPRILVLLFGGAVASFGIIPLIWLASKVIDGFAFADVNPGLGKIAAYGPGFAYLLVSLQRLWLIVPIVAMVVLVLSSGKRAPCKRPINLYLLGLAPIALLGVLMDVIMTGNANTYEYFSGPMYFVTSLILMGIVAPDSAVLLPARNLRLFCLLVTCVVTLGFLWVRLGLAEKIWHLAQSQLGQDTSIPQFLSTDSRISAAAVTIVILSATTRSKWYSPRLVLGSLLVSLSILTLYGYWNSAVSELQREREPSEIATSLGQLDNQLVGRWLRSNTLPTDLIATNELFDSSTGQPLSDFSLAAWSKREFLVLGPSFLGDYSRLRSQLDVSQQFGYAPSQTEAEQLRQWGVKWFVVDRLDSSFNDWENTWDVHYANEHFFVVKI